MHLFVTTLHIVLCVALILIILLQPGKDSASAFGGGGGGNQMYGPRGQANFLGRATTVVAGLFMVTSITLALFSTQKAQSSTDLEEEIQRLEAEEAASTTSVDAAGPVLSPPPPTGTADGTLTVPVVDPADIMPVTEGDGAAERSPSDEQQPETQDEAPSSP